MKIRFTYAVKGTKRVPGATCGHWKSKTFTFSADGYVIPRKTPLKGFVRQFFTINPNCKTFDSEVISNGFIQRILYPHVLVKNQS